jgi:hypothetical protein
MPFRFAPLVLTIVLATPGVAAAQTIGCDTSECGEVLPSTTTTTTTTSTTAPGRPAVVEVPAGPATTEAPEITQAAPQGGLPVTGADLVVLSVAGLSAIALGAGLRRRANR